MSMIAIFCRSTDSEIASLQQAPADIHEFVENADQSIDVDKAWNAIHFLLNGDPYDGAWPLKFILGGGVPIGDEDVGLGPAVALTSSRVKEIAEALQPLDLATLMSRWDQCQVGKRSLRDGR